MSIAENVALVRQNIARAAIAAGRDPKEITLVAASKMNNAERVREAIAAGVDACGENRVQELVEKNSQGAYAGAALHFIGHLQRNKVKQVVGVAELIHSVDSLPLLAAINAAAEAKGIKQQLLLEVNIGRELSKSGFAAGEIGEVLEKAGHFSSIWVRGLMAIPPICAFPEENHPYFVDMQQLFIDNSEKKYDNVSMDFLSMGMSGDYAEAIACGSTMVRVGAAIFGARVYN